MNINLPAWLQEKDAKAEITHLVIKSCSRPQKITFKVNDIQVVCRTNKLDGITCYEGFYEKLTCNSWDILKGQESKICHIRLTGEGTPHNVHIIYPTEFRITDIKRQYFNVKRNVWEVGTTLFPDDLMVISRQSPGNEDRNSVECGVDSAFKPLGIVGDAIGRLFGWEDHKKQ